MKHKFSSMGRVAIALVLALSLSLVMAVPAVAADSGTLYVQPSPTININGVLAPGEWDEATSYTLVGIGNTAYVTNDATYMYVAFDAVTADGFVSFNTYKEGAYAPEKLDAPVINYDGGEFWDTLADTDAVGVFETYIRIDGSTSIESVINEAVEIRVELSDLALAPGDAIKMMFVFVEGGVTDVYPSAGVGNDPTTYTDFTLFYSTIQAAIAAAEEGDTISVAAGTYNEAVRINKSNLTIKSISGAAETTITANTATTLGIGCTVQFAVGDDAEGLVEWDGIVTGSVLDGFTVINESEAGQEPDGRPVGVGFPSASGCVAKNLVIEGLSIDADPHVSGVIFGHDVGTAIGNILENSTISSCYNGFVVYGPGADGNIIRNNIVEGNSNGAWIEYETANTLVEYNDIINNTLLGIGIDEAFWSPSENIKINYNNIDGNGLGIKADYQVLTTPVDATNNWWGGVAGPDYSTNPYQTEAAVQENDSVSADVDYLPWLIHTELVSGWNIYSTPIAAESDPLLPTKTDTIDKALDLWGSSSSDKLIAYYYNGETQYWDEPTSLTPLQAVYIKMAAAATIDVVVSSEATSPPSTVMYTGWNLVGPAELEEKLVNTALLDAYLGTGVATDLQGYSKAISPPLHQTYWTYLRDVEATDEYFVPTEGYWVLMVNQGILGGLTTTPITYVP